MEPSDTSLVKQCLQGDNTGFDLLVKRYQRQIYVFCYRMLGDYDEASEAAQGSFVKAYNSLSSFRQDARFLTWLFKIASNTCIGVFRTRTRRREDSLDEIQTEADSLPSDGELPEHEVIRRESGELVQREILHLPEKYRVSLVMFHFNEMSIKEISQALGKPEGTVKSGLHIAREMLRQRLEGVINDGL